MERRLKILLSAYACEPGKGSEPGVGWNWAKQIARFHQVWVITRANNRKSIEQALQKEATPNVHWVYFDLPRWARFWKKGQQGVHFYYSLWQIGVYFVGRHLHKQVRFDLVHHVTFGQYWSPSFLAFLPARFIWGPVGGGESAPLALRKSFSLRGRIFELMRDCTRDLALLNPVMRRVARRASVVIACTDQTALRLSELRASQVVVHPQMGMTSEDIRRFMEFPTRCGVPFRLVSIGRLIHWKGFHLSLSAFAKVSQFYPDSEYWIINDGPEKKRLQELAFDLRVQDKVVFWGRLPTLQDVYGKLEECDVLVHPALHEAFGNVCIEAMAAGRPVICLNLGGPALLVTEDVGFKIPAYTPDQVVNGLAEALLKLANDLELRVRMGDAARKRVAEHFNWNKNGEFIQEVYQRAVQQE